MDCPSDIDLLLIGKTGNGKSATGNTILRKKAFKSKSATASVTKEVDFDVTDFNGKIIKVVDGPGVGDTRMDNKEAEDLVKRTMEYAITANPRGYHAFLIVVRFGGRFTEEDHHTIAFLKAIFGDDFVKRFGILILTCGDSFEITAEQEEVSFEEWVQQQEGIFQDLVQECNRRVLLFNNSTKDVKEKEAQIAKLLEIVENLQSKGTRYTDENFSRARETQHRIIVESKKPIIEEKTFIETSLILEKLNQAQKIKDPLSRADNLENLIVRVESLAISVQTQDRGTGALKDLMANVKSIKDSVSGEIKSCYTEKRERERISAYEAESRKRLEEERKKQMQDLEKQMKQIKLEEDRKKEMEKQKKEPETRQREAEAKARQEREKRERELKENRERVNEELKQKLEKMENNHQEIRQNNNKEVFDTVVNTVTWPLRNAARWIFG